MIFEIEDETRDFLTIYKKEFPTKEIERRKECRQRPKYPPPLNILNGPYRKYLNTQQKNAVVPLNERSEDPQEALNRIHEKYPYLKGHLAEIIPNQDTIEGKENEIKQTTYHTTFSKGVYSPRVKIFGREKDIRLPDDWVISETTQTKYFRNPWKIATKDLLRVPKAFKPPDNLVHSEEERRILRTRTGDTEYGASIGATGARVIKTCLFGPPLPLEPKIYTKGPNSPRSECSEILEGKKFVLPSNVI